LEAETSLLEDEVLEGDVFLAAQDDNPFNSMIAIYVVIRARGLGVFVKLAGRGTLDPKTGQLITAFGEPGQEIPQFPGSHLRVHFRGGPRGPLVTPPVCGAFTTATQVTSWANPGASL